MAKADRYITNGGYILADEHGIIASREAHGLFVPASTIKIVTSLVALNMLGDDYRFATDFFLSSDNKSLIIKGYGDPYLTSEEITKIAVELRQKGLQQVTDIVLDESAFQLENEPPGRERSSNPYDAACSALAVNFNTLAIDKSTDGKVVSSEPQTPTLPIMEQFGATLPPGRHRINLGNDKKAILAHSGQLFAALLRKQGIEVGERLLFHPVPPAAPLFHRHRSSKDLRQVVVGLLLYSNNVIANQLYLTCGAAVHGYPATWQGSRDTFRRFLDSLGLTHEQIVMQEGSGLSRDTKASPAAMLAVLRAFQPWSSLLAKKAGHPVKSGTLNGVFCYAGFFNLDGGQKPFVIMLNQERNNRDTIMKLLEKKARHP